MAFVTLQVVDGFERGMIFRRLTTPVTIGRERDNDVQLNDEQVSRFHVKIQEADGRLILTDLDSTNGTRVNGRPVKVRVLQVGDQLTMGRSVLVFGSPEEIARRNPATPEPQVNGTVASESPELDEPAMDPQASLKRTAAPPPEAQEPLFRSGPPELPQDLRPSQVAQLSDVMAFIHDELAHLSQQGREDVAQRQLVLIPWPEWQRLLQLAMTTARYLREVVEPRGDDPDPT